MLQQVNLLVKDLIAPKEIINLRQTVWGIAFVLAVLALFAGSLAAWFVISMIMDFQFTLLPGVAAATILAALAFTILLGLAGTWRILGQKAAPILREL